VFASSTFSRILHVLILKFKFCVLSRGNYLIIFVSTCNCRNTVGTASGSRVMVTKI